MAKPKSKRPPPPRDIDSGDAFIPDVARSHTRLIDDDAESFAEEFIAEATSAEHVAEDARDDRADEELDGLYVLDFDDLDEPGA
ncbi:MAG: hypothetical protein KIT84_40095 [Labilithrix sp.]|nr:hypothetical protein [Labilithrix sp.]MCW5817268.1 hypothetical protein [Labilithrix sp.]